MIEPTPSPALEPLPRGFRHSIRLKLTAFVAMIVLVVAGATGWTVFNLAAGHLRRQIDDRLMATASSRVKMVSLYESQQRQMIGLIASRTRLRRLLEDYGRGLIDAGPYRKESEQILLDARQTSDDFLAVWVTDRLGKVVASSDSEYLDRDFSVSHAFTEGMVRRSMDAPRVTEGRFETYVSAPALDARNEPLGVVMVLLDAGAMARSLMDGTGLGRTGEVLIGARREGRLAYLLPARLSRTPPEIPPGGDVALSEALAAQTGFARMSDYRGVQVLAAHAPIPGLGWAIVAKMDVAEAYAPIATLRRAFLRLFGLVFLVSVGGTYILAGAFARPALELAQSAGAIAAGDLSARVPVRSRDEVGQAAAVFNRMAEELGQSHASLERRVEERTLELRRSEDALRESREELQAILDNTTAVIYVKDLEGRYLLINRSFERLFHVTRDKISGHTDYDLFPKDKADAFRANDRRVAESRVPIQFEEVAPHDDGEHTYVSVKFPLFDVNGVLTATCGISTDITERKHAQRQIQALNADLEQRVEERTHELSIANEALGKAKGRIESLDAMKSAFIDVTSHELRTPMTVIIGMLSILNRRMARDPEMKNPLQAAIRAAERLERLVLRSLEMTREGQFDRRLDLAPVRVAELVRQTVTEVTPFVVARRQTLGANVAEGLPTVMMDRAKIQDALANLLMNAIKFTPDGGTIRVAVTSDDPADPGDAAFIRFLVADSGAGISERDRPHLFEMFFASLDTEHHSSGEFQFGTRGMGLGLAISKKFVEMHGGEIGVTTEPGKGSEFFFTLPLSPPMVG